MYIYKPSVKKIEAADRVNLLHGTRYRFEQYEMLVLLSLPKYAPFHDSPPCWLFQTRNPPLSLFLGFFCLLYFHNFAQILFEGSLFS